MMSPWNREASGATNDTNGEAGSAASTAAGDTVSRTGWPLISQAAEHVYNQSEPYLFAVYLSNQGRDREAIAFIEAVYGTVADIWQANNELAARLASYIMKETDWRDMKVVCAAFMLVQSRAGEPITECSKP